MKQFLSICTRIVGLVLLSVWSVLMVSRNHSVPALYLAFVSNRTGNNEIYRVRIDGQNLRNISRSLADDRSPRWSPLGTHLAFVSEIVGTPKIFITSFGGFRSRNLTQSLGYEDYPVWDADGRSIVFVSSQTGNQELYRQSIKGGLSEQLTTSLALERYPSRTPPRHEIVYTAVDQLTELFFIDAQGQHEKILIHETVFEPQWSPDGAWISFTSWVGGNMGGYDILRVRPDGSQLTNLSRRSRSDFLFSYSPDGKQLVFASERDDNREIYRMQADGALPINLTNDTAFDTSPQWSPDGQWIAFVSDRAGNQDIFVMRPDGTDLRNLTRHPAADVDPQWAPYSKANGHWTSLIGLAMLLMLFRFGRPIAEAKRQLSKGRA